jgi:proton-translocating NADH-quinone oxidoreductase chain N
LSGIDYLTLLLPEILLAAGGLAILILGLVWRGRKAYRPLSLLAILVSLGALAATLATGNARGALPQGMLAVDPFTGFFRVLGLACAAIVLLLALGHDRLGHEFPGLLLFAVLGILLTAGATNLVMIYVGIELLSITSYVLAGLLREEPRSNEAAIKYFLYGAIAAAVMVYGFSLLLGLTGSLELGGIAEGLKAASGPAASLRWVAVPAIVLMMVGLGFKVAAVPFHQWSPDVYEGAPTPVTAFLSVGPKAAGFAVMARVFLVALPALQVEWAALLAALAAVTMTVGNLVALWQTGMKRLLAYSSIAQAGYMLIGLASLQATGDGSLVGNGLVALLIYLAAYLLTNLGAFAVVISLEDVTGTDAISSYTGLVHRAPLVATALVFYFLSLVGIPPLACFLGKLLIFGAAIDARLYWLAAIGVVNSVISLAYYFRVVRLMFFEPEAGKEGAVRLPGNVSIAMAVTWIGTVGLVILGTPVIAWASQSASLFVR